VASGPHTLYSPGGVIWDTDAGTVEIVAATQKAGGYVEIQHRCSHPDNKNVDVGLRYQLQDGTDDDGTDCSPYTGDPAHEGDTNLSTKPTAPVNLAALSDDFSGAFDETKYMKCNAGFNFVSGAYGWYGTGGYAGVGSRVNGNPYPIVQTAGGVYFGTSSMNTEIGSGAALMMRWMMTGDFTVDLTLDQLTRLVADASQSYFLYAVVMSAANEGFGWVVRSTTGVSYKGVGLYFRVNNDCVIATGATTLVTGDVMRLSRSAGAMSIISQYGGANENITPATPPTLTDPMCLYFGAGSRSTSTWSNAYPGPGFSNLAISGTGGIGRYKGGVIHKFMWDALNDLGSVNKAVNLLAYFKQNNP
jgi:hypothetical protein